MRGLAGAGRGGAAAVPISDELRSSDKRAVAALRVERWRSSNHRAERGGESAAAAGFARGGPGRHGGGAAFGRIAGFGQMGGAGAASPGAGARGSTDGVGPEPGWRTHGSLPRRACAACRRRRSRTNCALRTRCRRSPARRCGSGAALAAGSRRGSWWRWARWPRRGSDRSTSPPPPAARHEATHQPRNISRSGAVVQRFPPPLPDVRDGRAESAGYAFGPMLHVRF